MSFQISLQITSVLKDKAVIVVIKNETCQSFGNTVLPAKRIRIRIMSHPDPDPYPGLLKWLSIYFLA
jgi:hypothetical protein